MDPTAGEGTIIAGKYRLETLLGSGGMGVVWSARELATDKSFAIKLIRDASSAPAVRRRFLQEARAASAVVHPHVVHVREVLELDDAPVIVMELLSGESAVRDFESQKG